MRGLRASGQKSREQRILQWALLAAVLVWLIWAASSGSLSALADKFYNAFIYQDRYKLITSGLVLTLAITAVAGVIGLVLGALVGIVRAANEMSGSFAWIDPFCRLYLTVIRGTPVIVQLMILYFLWMGKIGVHENLAAMIGFGLNSGAYVAEIVRSGIMSVENGQFEAGRSLGISYSRTMRRIILPQAVKNVLPALANEFIVLLKETSVASFIAVKDMMKGANALVGITYDMYMPYLSVAIIYLVLVLGLQKLVSLLEHKLRSSDR